MAKKVHGKKAREAIRRENDLKKSDSGKKLKDGVYNWAIDRYSKQGRRFTFSDQFFWKGMAFAVPEMVGYILFITFFLWLAHIGFERYGWERTIVFFILILTWRVQMAVKQLVELNKKLG